MVVGGDFEVERMLNAGGMGAVYVARQLSTGKCRALEVMHPQLVADERLRERFEQEARVGASIRSRHVVEVIAAGSDAGSATGMASAAAAPRLHAGPKRPKLEPFPMQSVQKQLEQSARGAAVLCTNREGPKSFAVTMTWLPSGQLKSVTTGDGGKIPTPTEMCTTALFHSVRVGPYAGTEVTLGQAVNIP